MSLRNLREKINVALYGHKEQVLSNLRIISMLVSLLAVGTLIFYYGYPQSKVSDTVIFGIIKGTFVFYVLSYLIKFIYDFHPITFLKKTWFEAILVLILVVEGVSEVFFGQLLIPKLFKWLGVSSFGEVSTVFIQLYFLILMAVQTTRARQFKIRIRLNPAVIFMASFLVIILAGTGLLMMPAMTENGIGFLDALFTSTSATCVTGLLTENISEFTYRGQVVLLILIKLGGLNIIAFGSFMTLFSRFGLGVRQHEIVEDFVNKDSFLSAKGLLGRIIIWSSVIELFGAALMYFSWDSALSFKSFGDKVFSSVFHSVSAFNNAGISLFDDGINDAIVRHNYSIHIILGVLIFIGALGFNSIFDLFGLNRIRERIKFRWKEITLSTKIALYFSIILVVIGMGVYLLTESNHTMQGESGVGAVVSSFFQSVNRTSGFATIDYGEASIPFLLVMIFLMFVGASSSSTGGGIKTSSFAVIWATIRSVVTGRHHIELFKRTISSELAMRAFAVLVFFLVGNLVCVVLLSITEADILAQSGRGIIDLIFEEVSALGTVGLSTGITSELSDAGKTIIIISMFVGRVGTLTVAFGLGKRLLSRNYQYPSGHTMVG